MQAETFERRTRELQALVGKKCVFSPAALGLSPAFNPGATGIIVKVEHSHVHVTQTIGGEERNVTLFIADVAEVREVAR